MRLMVPMTIYDFSESLCIYSSAQAVTTLFKCVKRIGKKIIYSHHHQLEPFAAMIDMIGYTSSVMEITNTINVLRVPVHLHWNFNFDALLIWPRPFLEISFLAHQKKSQETDAATPES